MSRTATWRNVGTDVKEANGVAEVIKMAGLDYEVVKAPVYLSNGYKIPNTFCTKKKNTNDTFGIVGKDYTIVQNSDAFAFVDSIVSEGLTFEKAGETSWMNYIIASLPTNEILGDKFKPYIIFQNSHSGSSPLKAAICPLRMVCENQFTMAFKGADNRINLRHTTSVNDRLHSAKEVLAMNAGYMETFSKNAEALALKKFSAETVEDIINEYYKVPDEASTRKANSLEDKRAIYISAYNAEDNQNFKGTAWGMVNAYTDYMTHLEPARKTKDWETNKFTNVTLNTGLIERFMEMILARV